MFRPCSGIGCAGTRLLCNSQACLSLQAEVGTPQAQHVIQVYDPAAATNSWKSYSLQNVKLDVDGVCTQGSAAVTISAQPLHVNNNVWQTATVSATLGSLQWRLAREGMQQAPQAAQPPHQHALQQVMAAQQAQSQGAPIASSLRLGAGGAGQPASAEDHVELVPAAHARLPAHTPGAEPTALDQAEHAGADRQACRVCKYANMPAESASSSSVICAECVCVRIYIAIARVGPVWQLIRCSMLACVRSVLPACRQHKPLASFDRQGSYPKGRRTICKNCRTCRGRLKRLPQDWPAEQRTEDWLRDALQVRAHVCCISAAQLLHAPDILHTPLLLKL